MIYLSHFSTNTETQKEKCFCSNPRAIENYAFAISDDKRMWECHHRLETHFSDGTPRPRNAQLSKEELIALGMYYNRPAEELIFLTKPEHRKLHNRWVNHTEGHTEETKKKISDKLKENPNVGGDRIQGKKWFNNGYINVREYVCPPGFVPGRIGLPKGRKVSEETRKKMSASLKGRKPTFLGKHHSEETKRKISETKKKKN